LIHHSFDVGHAEMKNIAAYLLLQLGGKATPTAADITSVLEAAGAEVDSSRIEKLISELEGKDINEVRRDRPLGATTSYGIGSLMNFPSTSLSPDSCHHGNRYTSIVDR
jgi:hypothetical protein